MESMRWHWLDWPLLLRFRSFLRRDQPILFAMSHRDLHGYHNHDSIDFDSDHHHQQPINYILHDKPHHIFDNVNFNDPFIVRQPVVR